MERSFAELRQIVECKRTWERIFTAASLLMMCVAVFLILDQKEKEEIAAERMRNRAFGLKGRIIDIYPSTDLCDHLFNSPIIVVLENGERPRPQVTTVEVRNWLRPLKGKVWDLRLVDPDTNGRCTLRLEKYYDVHPWPELVEPIPGYEQGRYP